MKFKSLIILIVLSAGFGIWKWHAAGNGADAPEATGSRLKEETRHAPALMSVMLPDSITSQIKDYEGFSVSFNKDNHTPNYVVWELLPEETEGEVPRQSKFWTDTDIEGCATDYDYRRSGYDRGHICPAADQKWSARAMHDCFVMANICPQDHRLNSGAWATLEKRERTWTRKHDGLIIAAGPIYDKNDTQRIGATGVRVPSAFFKVFLAHRAEKPQALAVVYPNMSAYGNMTNYYMSVDELEKITGFDFFYALPDDEEAEVEKTFNPKEWR